MTNPDRSGYVITMSSALRYSSSLVCSSSLAVRYSSSSSTFGCSSSSALRYPSSLSVVPIHSYVECIFTERIRFGHGGRPSFKMPLHGVFKAVLNGMHERGDGGFLYVKGDDCAYMFPSELKGHDDVRSTLEELLEDEKAKMVFYVLEERDNNLHVLAYPRERVMKDMIESNQWSPRSAPTIQDVDE